METAKNFYNRQYESWMPWIEDQYLSWTGQNKASYVAEDNLDKTKVTGNKDVDAVQDSVNKGVSGQFAKGGALEGVGNLVSKEGVNRSERGGKNESGGYGL